MQHFLSLFTAWAQDLGPAPKQLFEITDVFKTIAGLIVTLAGFLLFFMLVVGGFKFLASGGEPKAVASARNTITFALIGLIVIISSIIILWLISQFTGLDVTIISIPH